MSVRRRSIRERVQREALRDSRFRRVSVELQEVRARIDAVISESDGHDRMDSDGAPSVTKHSEAAYWKDLLREIWP